MNDESPATSPAGEASPPPPAVNETAVVPAAAAPARDWKERVLRGLLRHEDERDDDPPSPPAPPAPRQLAPGATLGRYRVVRELGRGGMGAVFEAEDTLLARRVALKTLLGGAERPEALERFQVEARAVARLRHPNIVGLHEVGEEGGQHFLVMELIEGESLAARLRREGPLEPREAARLAERLADALFCAHTRSILHRDVKPANVLLDAQGEPLLGDFGLAKEVERAGAGPTESGVAMGTPAYMPPEQVKGELDRVDRRSDVYSLGVTLFEMLTGRLPFAGSSIPAVLRAILDAEPPLPSALCPGLDADLETICLRCLEKEPDARYASANELALDLRRYLKDEPIAARRPGVVDRAGRWLRRNRGLARALGVTVVSALLVIGAGTVAFLQRLRRERDRAEAAAREAREALELLVSEVKTELDDVPGERVRGARERLLRRASERLLALQAWEDAPEDALSQQAAEAYRQIADLSLEAGDTARAEEACTRAVALSRARVAAQPGAVLPLRGLMASLHALADVAAARKAPATELALCEETLALGERIANALPADPLAREQLAICLQRIGTARRRLGQHAPARAAYERALALCREQRARAETPDTLRSLTHTLDQLASLEDDEGDLAAALALREEALALDRRLAALQPENVTVQRNLGSALTKVGSTRLARGDLRGATPLQEEALALQRRLIALDPSSLHVRRGLGAALIAVGNLRELRGDLAGALALFQEAVALFRELRVLDPADPAALHHLGVALSRTTTIGFEDDRPGARAVAREVVALQRELLARAGAGDVSARQSLADALVDLGDAERRAGDPAAGRAALEEALALLRALPGVDARLELIRALHLLAEALEAAKEPPALREAVLVEALAVARQRVAEDPSSTKARRYVGHGLVLLADLPQEFEVARGRLREAEAVLREVAALDPENARDRRSLAVALGYLGRLFTKSGDRASALPPTEEATALLRWLAARDPTNVGARRDLRMTLETLGDLRRNLGDLTGAAEVYLEAAALTSGAESSVPPRELFMALTSAAQAAFERDEQEVAGRGYVDALKVARLRLAADPQVVAARRDLCVVLVRLSDVRINTGDQAGGVALIEEAVELHRPLVDALPDKYRQEHAVFNEVLADATAELAREGPTGALALAYARLERGAAASAVEAFAAALVPEAICADLARANVYNAARAASLAAAAAPDEAARAALVEQGLVWLADDLRRRRALANDDAARAALAHHLDRVRSGDPDLAALRRAPRFVTLVD
jgi:serine/threonine-protein kinase